MNITRRKEEKISPTKYRYHTPPPKHITTTQIENKQRNKENKHLQKFLLDTTCEISGKVGTCCCIILGIVTVPR